MAPNWSPWANQRGGSPRSGMTLPGGPADKLGNRYEKWWTVSEGVRMLHGDAEAIRIEAPGVEKAEFVRNGPLRAARRRCSPRTTGS